MANKLWHKGLTVMGRSGLASLFILGSVNKVLSYADTQDRMVDVSLVPASILLPATILLELIGGVALVYGRRPAVVAGVALSLFTLATNYWFHDFWRMEGEIASLELSLFFKNVAIASALIFVASVEMRRSEAT